MKIKKPVKTYAGLRVYKSTTLQLHQLSKKTGLYVVEVLADIVSRYHREIFEKK